MNVAQNVAHTSNVAMPRMSAVIRVALVEDDTHFQQAAIRVIGTASDMVLTGVASTLNGALRMLEQPAPDILLVDLGLPDGSGIDMIRAARATWPECSSMVCTALGDDAHVMRSIEAGASGYLLKDSSPDAMLGEIRSLHGGGSPISPLIARQILTRFRATIPTAKDATTDTHGDLSERELQVLQLVTRGFTAREISELIHVSHNTVLTYVRRIYSKLNVCSKAEAIYEARNRGLLAR